MRVDFSSRNPYSDGAEWKWRLKDKDDHVIEGARERFGKVGKVIGEDFGNIKGNVGIEMNKKKDRKENSGQPAYPCGSGAIRKGSL